MKKYFSSIGLGYLTQDDLLRWLKQYTETPATIYDDAMDAVYNATKEHGSIHRLFDGGHDPVGAWEAVKNASDTDTFTQEVIGYVSAMFKDMSTVEGMPFFKYDREWYDQTSEWLTTNIPGGSTEWLKDLMTYDTFEVFSSSLSVIAVMFHLKNDDIKALSRVLGAMSILSIISLNPIMGVAVICLSAYAFVVKKNKLDRKEFLKGGAVSGVAAIVFTTIGLRVILEFIIFLALVQILKKKVITAKEIQKKLYDLSYGHHELVKLMLGAESEYQKLLTSSNLAISDARSIEEKSDEELEKRKEQLDLIKKMK
jgi:hypothetical protein